MNIGIEREYRVYSARCSEPQKMVLEWFKSSNYFSFGWRLVAEYNKNIVELISPAFNILNRDNLIKIANEIHSELINFSNEIIIENNFEGPIYEYQISDYVSQFEKEKTYEIIRDNFSPTDKIKDIETATYWFDRFISLNITIDIPENSLGYIYNRSMGNVLNRYRKEFSLKTLSMRNEYLLSSDKDLIFFINNLKNDFFSYIYADDISKVYKSYTVSVKRYNHLCLEFRCFDSSADLEEAIEFVRSCCQI